MFAFVVIVVVGCVGAGACVVGAGACVDVVGAMLWPQ